MNPPESFSIIGDGFGCQKEADGYADSLKQAVESAEVIVGGIPMEKKGIVHLREYANVNPPESFSIIGDGFGCQKVFPAVRLGR